jgi:hypothetical protein
MKISLKQILVVLAIVAMVLPVAAPADAQSLILKWRLGLNEDGAEVRIGERYPMPVQTLPMVGYVATQTFDVGTSTAKLIPTLATNTRSIMIGSTVGVLNYGNANVPNGTGYPFTIASGSWIEITVATRTPAIYLRGQAATCPTFILEK